MLTLVYQIEADCVRLLWECQGRTEQSIGKFCGLIGERLAVKVEFVCSDMWRGTWRSSPSAGRKR